MIHKPCSRSITTATLNKSMCRNLLYNSDFLFDCNINYTLYPYNLYKNLSNIANNEAMHPLINCSNLSYTAAVPNGPSAEATKRPFYCSKLSTNVHATATKHPCCSCKLCITLIYEMDTAIDKTIICHLIT